MEPEVLRVDVPYLLGKPLASRRRAHPQRCRPNANCPTRWGGGLCCRKCGEYYAILIGVERLQQLDIITAHCDPVWLERAAALLLHAGCGVRVLGEWPDERLHGE